MVIIEIVKKVGNFLFELMKMLLSSALIVFLLINFVLIPCAVEGSSMYPNLVQGDFGYSFIITKMIGIKRFDVAVIKTGDDSSSKLIVKRVIGLPNETLEFKDNKLYINGEYVEEPFLNNTNTADFKEVLGSNEYFCMGDNREVSRDSRFYGPFSSKQIRSTHLMIFYPFARFGMR